MSEKTIDSSALLDADGVLLSGAEWCEHIETCPGCHHCDAMLEFYGGCDACGEGGHKDTMYYDPRTGRTVCYGCFHGASNAAIEAR